MLTSLSSAVSGLDSFQQDMDVIGNNIANINTDGYKSARVNFADAFTDTLQAAGAGTVQVGTGVYDQNISNDWTQGAITSTGLTTDLAISGNGFFIVKDPTSQQQFVTQDGSFSVDANGYLVTGGGQQVQGYTTTGSTTLGSLQINTANAGGDVSPISSFTIDSSGNINVTQADGNTFVAGQIAVQNFQDPQALMSQTGNLYSNQANAGGGAVSVPGQNGTGTLQSGYLEVSNVDLSAEMADLITAQRGFEANSKIVTTSDEVLETLVNMKR